ncbi:hypothetical protein KJZ63_03600 [Patescibacteria group bacterium]|nr:hypothetical protein [Patescibacteria group bacterium]
MSIKLISLNIEGNKHLEDRVLPFLLKRKPEVVTLQEVFLSDVPKIEEALGMNGIFIPMADVNYENEHLPARGLWGILHLTKLNVVEASYQYYYGVEEEIPKFFANQDPNSMNRVLVWQVVEKEGQFYRFATTHFTWSKDGQTIDLQKQTYQSMNEILKTFPDVILTGDFNAPRGREIFTNLSKSYTDNIPQDITTTIDNNLHKAKANIQFVVDGCFTSGEYKASEVEVVDGVSDHMAVVATISKL